MSLNWRITYQLEVDTTICGDVGSFAINESFSYFNVNKNIYTAARCTLAYSIKSY